MLPKPLPPHCLAIGLIILSSWLSGCTTQVASANLQGDAPAPAALEFCGTLALPGEWQPLDDVAPVPLGGLSAMAWDNDEQRLYLLSDRGRLHQAIPVFRNGRLVDLTALSSHRLTDRDGRRLEGKAADAESLVLINDRDNVAGNTQLLVGFEQDHRVEGFTTTGVSSGRIIRSPLTASAADNQSLEALAWVPGLGLVAGLEAPPTDMPQPPSDDVSSRHTLLFSLPGDDTPVTRWHYPLASAPGSALTELLTLEDAASTRSPRLLALERAFSPPHPLTITLSLVELHQPPTVDVTRLASLSAGDGWRIDNMEGLASLPEGSILMVSDDNFSALQRNLLSCFRLRQDLADTPLPAGPPMSSDGPPAGDD
ncbi:MULTISPECIES: esterase-like activity of phytase family protein [Halomonas]|uniref:esterase-like activity of phytase family protein n=1 Tax=Halomonas TaxID=2745 RepID=UPI001A90AB12|nr:MULTISPECIES: esterase-like activity of phytase family protein [Halomonas]MBN8413029.1 esterase-like activity of phytase family protein [Halomonas litopenaei]MBY5983725.1 esterase-like activity of phytase family protein [Halomonas sp. DP5Y7-2]